MKTWSNKWKGSKQVRKQRKYRSAAPDHARRRFLSVHLSKELRQKHKRRSIPVRVGDTVRVLRGRHKGESGTVSSVDLASAKVQVDGIQFDKADGSVVIPDLQPSNLMITVLDTKDKRRLEGEQTNG